MKVLLRYCIALLTLATTLPPAILLALPEKQKADSVNNLIQKISSDTERVKTLISISFAMPVADSNNKILLAKQAKELAEKIKWKPGIYEANRNLGSIYFTCQKTDMAIEALEDNVKLAKSNKDTFNEATAIQCLARVYHRLSAYQKSLECYNKILSITADPDMRIVAFGNMGVVYNGIGDYANALSSYTNSLAALESLAKSKKGAVSIQDTLQQAGLQLNIGDTYLAMAQPDKAINNYQNVLILSAAIKDMYFQIAGSTGIGKTFRLKNNYQKAIEYYSNALHECSEINDFDDEVKLLNELANTYLETNDFTKAMGFADSALRVAEEQHYIYLPSRSFTTLGNIYIKQKQYDKAITALKKAVDISQKNNLLEDQKDAWLALSNAFEAKGQYKDSKEAFINYYATRDSIDSIEKENAVMRKGLEADFTTKKIVDSLKQNNEYEMTIATNRNTTYVLSTGLVLGLLLVFFVYRNHNTQKKYNELLKDKK